jgi:AcrR family transcriptional regulator
MSMPTTLEPARTSAGPTAPGRPRSANVDAAILTAAVELLAAAGPAGVTINAVARRSGVARASIYLRFAGREALLRAAMRSAIGRAPYPLSGDFVTDLRSGAEQARAILAEPRFQAVLPMLVGQLLSGGGLEPLTFDTLFPNRLGLADAYRRSAAGAGLRTDANAEQVVDLIVGALLVQLLATRTAPSAAAAQAAVDLVLDGLRIPRSDDGPVMTQGGRTRRL